MYKVYKITNLKSGIVYIGSTKNYERRVLEHKNVKKESHLYNLPLYKDMREIGKDNFSFEVIEKCKTEKEVLEKENKYILEHFLENNLYNKATSNKNKNGLKYTIYKREEKYNVNKNKLKREVEKDTFKEVGRLYGVSDNTIRDWCKDYGIDTKKVSEKRQGSKEFSEKMSKIAEESSTMKKSIAMLDKNTKETLKVFDSIGEAERYVDGRRANITKSIRGSEGRKTAYGYKWEFV